MPETPPSPPEFLGLSIFYSPLCKAGQMPTSISFENPLSILNTVQPPKWSPNWPQNDTDPEMIPISFHAVAKLISY